MGAFYTRDPIASHLGAPPHDGRVHLRNVAERHEMRVPAFTIAIWFNFLERGLLLIKKRLMNGYPLIAVIPIGRSGVLSAYLEVFYKANCGNGSCITAKPTRYAVMDHFSPQATARGDFVAFLFERFIAYIGGSELAERRGKRALDYQEHYVGMEQTTRRTIKGDIEKDQAIEPLVSEP